MNLENFYIEDNRSKLDKKVEGELNEQFCEFCEYADDRNIDMDNYCLNQIMDINTRTAMNWSNMSLSDRLIAVRCARQVIKNVEHMYKVIKIFSEINVVDMTNDDLDMKRKMEEVDI